MECKKVLSVLDDYIDNELNKNISENVSIHLNTCENCKAQYELINSMTANLRELDNVELPENLHENIMEAVNRDRKIKFNFVIPTFLKDWRVYTTVTACLFMLVIYKIGIDKKNNDLLGLGGEYPPIVSPFETIEKLKESEVKTNEDMAEDTVAEGEDLGSAMESPNPQIRTTEAPPPRRTVESAPTQTRSRTENQVDGTESSVPIKIEAPSETPESMASLRIASEPVKDKVDEEDAVSIFGGAGGSQPTKTPKPTATPKPTTTPKTSVTPKPTDSPKKREALSYSFSKRSSLVKVLTEFVIIDDSQYNLAKEVFEATKTDSVSGMRSALNAKGIYYKERERVIEDRTQEHNQLVENALSIKSKLQSATSDSEINKYVNELNEVRGKINALIEYCNARKLAISL